MREREPFEDFLAVTVRRPGHEPWMLRVVTDPAGEVVGTAMLIMSGDPVTEGYIERLAVRKDQRGQGLAQALLVDAFEQGRQHGAPRSGLSTDSRTGALSLYEKVGMVVVDTWVNRGISSGRGGPPRGPSRDPVTGPRSSQPGLVTGASAPSSTNDQRWGSASGSSSASTPSSPRSAQ